MRTGLTGLTSFWGLKKSLRDLMGLEILVRIHDCMLLIGAEDLQNNPVRRNGNNRLRRTAEAFACLRKSAKIGWSQPGDLVLIEAQHNLMVVYLCDCMYIFYRFFVEVVVLCTYQSIFRSLTSKN